MKSSTNKLKLTLLWVAYLSMLLISTRALATDTPMNMTVSGQLFDASDNPLLDTVDFRLEIIEPSGDGCLLYEEVQTGIDVSGSNGKFSLVLGAGTPTGPSNNFVDVFQNSYAITSTGAGASCGTYTPSTSEVRYIRVNVTPSSTLTEETMSPNLVVNSVPNALVCQTLQGLAPSSFISQTGSVTDANMATLVSGGDASSLHTHDSLYASKSSGSSQNFSGNVTTTGSVAIGTVSPNYDLSFGGDITRQIGQERASSGAGNNLGVVAGGAQSGATDTNGGNLLLRSGTSTGTGTSEIQFETAGGGGSGSTDNVPTVKMVITGDGYVGIGSPAPAPSERLHIDGAILVGDTSGTNNGAIRFNGTNFQGYNGGWVNLDSTSSGDITDVTTGAGSGLSGGAASGSVTLNIVTDGTTLQVNGSNELEIVNGSITAGKIADQTLVDTKFSGITGNCSSGEVLQTNGSGGFSCAVVGSGDITDITTGAGSGLSGGAASGSVTLNIVTDGTTLQVNGSNELEIVNGSITAGKIADQTLVDTKFSGISANCSSGEVLQTNGSGGFSCAVVGSGDITDVTTGAGSGLSGGAASGSVTLNIVTDGTTLQVNGSNELEIVNGSITAGKIADQTLVDTKFSGISANCSSGEVLQTNGSGGFSCAVVGSGDITDITTGAGSGLSGGAASGSVTLNIVTDGTTLQVNGSNELEIVNGSITAGKIADQTLVDTKFSGITGNCSSGEVLEANGSGGFSCTSISGTPPAGISGDIQFNSGGGFGSDALNFVWDDSLDRLGIGTSTPDSRLDVKGGSAILPAPEGSEPDGNLDNNQYSIYTMDSTDSIHIKAKDLSGNIIDKEIGLGGGGASAAGSQPGALQFTNGSGTFLSNDASLVWDDGNAYLGVGLTDPRYPLHVQGQDLSVSTTHTRPFAELVVEGQNGSIETFANDTPGNFGSSISFGTMNGGLLNKWSIIRGTSANSNRLQFRYGSSNDPETNPARFMVDVLGRVGIGGTTPNAGLQIGNIVGDDLRIDAPVGENANIQMNFEDNRSGLVNFSEGGFNKAKLEYYGQDNELRLVTESAGKLVLGTYTADNIIFRTDWGSSLNPDLIIDSVGNVGIGLSNPSAPLHVNGNIWGEQICDETGSTCTDISTLGSGGGIGGSGSVGYVPVFTNSSSIANSNIYSTGDGKVGIGNSTPAFLVDIGSTTSARTRLYSNDPTGFSGLILEKSSDTNFEIGAGSTGNNFFIRDNIASKNRMSILPSGHVALGGGDTSPDAHLEVSAGGTAGGPAFMVSSDDSTDGDLFIVLESGSVGIGTQTPSRPLHVSGPMRLQPLASPPSFPVNGDMYIDQSDNKLRVYDGTWQILGSGGSGTNDEIHDADFDTQIQVEETANDDTIRFDTAGIERMVIDKNGKVGIGMTDATAAFRVIGQARVDSIRIGTSSVAGRVLTTDANGIGTWQNGLTGETSTGATARTHLGGSATSGVRGVALGFRAGYTSTGDDDIYIGYQAAAAGGAGDGNVVIGAGAQQSTAISGNGNVVLGNLARLSAGSSSDVVAIGKSSIANTSGVAIGSGAISGSGGVAIGRGAAAANQEISIGVYNFGYEERIKIDSVGKVGIGVSNPSEKLDVNGTVNMVGFRMGTSTTNGHVLTVDSFGNGTWQPAAGGGGDFQSDGSVPMSGNFQSGNNWISNDGDNEGLKVSPNGSVGVGVSSPSATFEVKGNGINAYDLMVTSSSSSVSGNAIRVHNSGMVGIGMTASTPGYPLHVEGDAVAKKFAVTSSGSSGSPSFYFENDVNTGIFRPGSNKIAISASGNEGLRIVENPLNVSESIVGIGTTAPSEILDIGIGSTGPAFSIGSQKSSKKIALTGSFWNGSSEIKHKFTMEHKASNAVNEAGHFAISRDSNELFKIDQVGRVGLGGTVPQVDLHVTDVDGDGAASIVLTSATESFFTADRTGDTKDTGFVVSENQIDQWLIGLNANDFNKRLYFKDRTTGPSGLNVMVLERTSGNVGIGTSTPSRTLHVSGNQGMRLEPSALPFGPTLGDIVVDSGDANKLKWYDGTSWVAAGGAGGGGGDFMADGSVTMTGNFRTGGNWISNDGGNEGIMIEPNGNVGIGTTSGVFEKFVVSGNVSVENGGRYMSSSDGSAASVVYGNQSGNTGMYFSGSSIRFSSGGSAKASINGSTGNLGLNDLTADAQLEIVKDAGEAPIMISSTSNSDGDLLIMNNTGYVGIGESSPSSKLHLANGDLYIDQGSAEIEVQTSSSTGLIVQSSDDSFANPLQSWMDSSGIVNLAVDHDGKVLARDGGVGDPSYSFLSDNNTGISRSTYGGVAIQTNSYTVFDSHSGTGNVGIGTTPSSEKLSVGGKIKADAIKFKNNSVQDSAGALAFLVREDKASGNNGDLCDTSPKKRSINTEVFDFGPPSVGYVTLSSGDLIFNVKGKYYCEAKGMATWVVFHKAQLQNGDGPTQQLWGTVGYDNDNDDMDFSEINGIINVTTIDGNNNKWTMNHYCSDTTSGLLGEATGLPGPEIYATIKCYYLGDPGPP